MYTGADSIIPANLPSGYDCYFGYVDGRWPDYAQIAAMEKVPVFGLTVFASLVAGQGVDIEPSNAVVSQAIQATKAELARGVDRPIVYTMASWVDSVVAAYTAAGVARSSYRLGSAHYAGYEHICGPTTCNECQNVPDGTQWASYTNYDVWILDDTFLNASPHPGPPDPSKEPEMIMLRMTTGAVFTFNGALKFSVPNTTIMAGLEAAGIAVVPQTPDAAWDSYITSIPDGTNNLWIRQLCIPGAEIYGRMQQASAAALSNGQTTLSAAVASAVVADLPSGTNTALQSEVAQIQTNLAQAAKDLTATAPAASEEAPPAHE